MHNKYVRYLQSQKETVRLLRRRGLSLNQIKAKTSIPHTTIRTWITDITLSEKQLDVLKKRIQKYLQAGRIRAQKVQKEKRIKNENKFISRGKLEIGQLSHRELLLTGIALYWAEGFKNKHEHRLGFCNSDPTMIRFYITWLQKCLKVKKTEMTMRLTLNHTYKDRVDALEEYWSKFTGIPRDQFTKPFYQNTTWKKEFDTDNYHGVLRIHVKKSLDNLLQMRGWIDGLSSSVIK